MKTLLLSSLFVFNACDTIGNEGKTNVYYEKEILECDTEDNSITIDVSDGPIINFLMYENDKLFSWYPQPPIQMGDGTGNLVVICKGSENTHTTIEINIIRPEI